MLVDGLGKHVGQALTRPGLFRLNVDSCPSRSSIAVNRHVLPPACAYFCPGHGGLEWELSANESCRRAHSITTTLAVLLEKPRCPDSIASGSVAGGRLSLPLRRLGSCVLAL